METVMTKLSTLIDAAKPFARIASWNNITDKGTDGLDVTVTVTFPKSRIKVELTGKDLRLLGEAVEAAKETTPVTWTVRVGEYELLANHLKTARDEAEAREILVKNQHVIEAALFVAGRAISPSASATAAEMTLPGIRETPLTRARRIAEYLLPFAKRGVLGYEPRNVQVVCEGLLAIELSNGTWGIADEEARSLDSHEKDCPYREDPKKACLCQYLHANAR